MCAILLGCLLVPTLLVALSAGAQIVGTPGNGPLTPGGARQGLGPPSITDSVPDLRLRSDGGGIPGAGPPVGYGARQPVYGRPQGRSELGVGTYATTGRRCQTPERVCRLAKAAPLEAGCSCRRAGRGRSDGYVVP